MIMIEFAPQHTRQSDPGCQGIGSHEVLAGIVDESHHGFVAGGLALADGDGVEPERANRSNELSGLFAEDECFHGDCAVGPSAGVGDGAAEHFLVEFDVLLVS